MAAVRFTIFRKWSGFIFFLSRPVSQQWELSKLILFTSNHCIGFLFHFPTTTSQQILPKDNQIISVQSIQTRAKHEQYSIYSQSITGTVPIMVLFGHNSGSKHVPQRNKAGYCEGKPNWYGPLCSWGMNRCRAFGSIEYVEKLAVASCFARYNSTNIISRYHKMGIKTILFVI